MLKEMKSAARRFAKDENGAALIEYSVLIGIITVGVIATVVLVGNWVGTQWTTLDANLNAT